MSVAAVHDSRESFGEPEPRPHLRARTRLAALLINIRFMLLYRYLVGLQVLSHNQTGLTRPIQHVLLRAVVRAKRDLRRGRRLLERLQASRQRLVNRQHTVLARVREFAGTPVRGARGQRIPIRVALREAVRLQRRVDTEEASGSHRHERVGAGRRAIAAGLPVLEFALLCWFMAGVLNVDLDRPGFTAVMAAALAALGSVTWAAWSRTLAAHLRRYKGGSGSLAWRHVDPLGRAMTYLTVVGGLLLAVLMYMRVDDEVYQATGRNGLAGVVLSLVLASASLILTEFLLYISFADGSNVTDDLDHLARVTRKPIARLRRDMRRAERLGQRIRAAEMLAVELEERIAQVADRHFDQALLAIAASRAVEPGPPAGPADLPTPPDQRAALRMSGTAMATLAQALPDWYADEEQ
jgi:hypothetical protein